VKRARTAALVAILIVVTPLGLLSKHYHGPFDNWVHDSSGDILYEVFWTCLLAILLPSARPSRITLGVFLVTGLIEFSQLLRTSLLQQIRRTFFGRLLIGTTFSWLDFAYYALGCLLALAYIHAIRLLSERKLPGL
jgi:hypothetical protein